MALATPHLVLEVPLSQFDTAAAPTVEVPGDETCFEFAQLPQDAARAGKSERQQSSSSSRCLVWQLEGSAPNQLLLQEVGVNEERRDGSARLAFASPLLPAVSCTESPQFGGTLLAVVTADGRLHTIRHTLQAAQPGAASLARKLQAPGAVTSIPLAAHFQRAGAPTAILEVGGLICIGTEEGNLVCLPAGSADPADAFHLAPTSSLGKVLTGFFGRPAGQAVLHLQELRFLDRRLLAAIHDGSQLRLWDLQARRLVHSNDLLLSGLTGQLVPTLARLTGEPLDASTSILLVYFTPRDPASSEPGMLATYEVFLEQRGEGQYKVLVELGPRLDASIHRLHDLAPENVALHTVGAWLLYDDDQGRRRLDCVPISFQDGPPEGETHVHLIEEQLLEGCQADAEGQEIEREAWQAVEARLAATGGAAAASGAALSAAFVDAVVAPGRLSRAALHAALAGLGSSADADAIGRADLAELKVELPRWVAAGAPPASPAAPAGGTAAASLARWTAFLEAYAAAWRRLHRPTALLQLPPQGDPHALLLARQGGLFSILRPAVAAEVAMQSGAPPPEWQQLAAEDAEAAAPALRAAAAVAQAAGGGQLPRLLWACLHEGLDLSSVVLPAVVHSLAGGAPPSAAHPSAPAPGTSTLLGFAAAGGAGGAGARAAARSRWRAACRKLPLQLARLFGGADSGGSGGASFVAAVAAAIKILESDWRDASRIRSPLPAATKPIRTAVLATLAQVSWAQLAALSQLALLVRHMLWSRAAPTWSLAPEEAAHLEGHLLPRILDLLRAAATAHWAAVTPAPDSSADGGAAAGSPFDPAEMVVSLRIGDGDGGRRAGAAAAAKRARLAQGQTSYVAALLLAAAADTTSLHVVRDLPDLQQVCLLLSQRLLCLLPSPLHAAAPGASHRSQSSAGLEQRAAKQLSPDDAAVAIAAELFAGRHVRQLAALQALLPADGRDMRLLFFRACSAARQISAAASPDEQQRLEEESCALFFRVAAVFGDSAEAFAGQAAAVGRCVQQLLEDGSAAGQAAAEAAAGGSSPQAQELRYYEALMVMYERLGRYDAATRFALAAARQVAAAMPHPEQLAARAAAQGRLWANVFSCCLEAGRYEEAYVALLSNEVAEVQLDCLHRLLGVLCSSPRGVELLCRLPFAHNLAVVRGGRQVWVPMVEEVVATLQRRAAQLDVGASPQPYKVLADFHISRSGYQAAAAAMLAYARRLVQECPDDAAALAEAEQAQATAVSCLSLVERQHAWVLDPAAAEQQQAAGAGVGDAPVLTLAALKREYAVAQGRAALAAAMPGGQQAKATMLTPAAAGHAGPGEGAPGEGAEDVFSQLLALDLHDAAFQLAEAAFVGTQLTRALEQVYASLATACVKRQLALGRPASSAAGASSAAQQQQAQQQQAAGVGDTMDTEDVYGGAAADAAGAAGGSGGADGSAAAATAEWRRLKDWLHSHEGGEHRFRLRLVILDAILRAEPAFMLPPWLMAAFQPGAPSKAAGSSADLAGVLRVLMRHGRLADAAALAAKHLQHVLHTVPSVAMARMAQVYFPDVLLDELAEQLGAAASAAELAREKQQLEELLRRVRSSAASQTGVIEQLFAQ